MYGTRNTIKIPNCAHKNGKSIKCDEAHTHAHAHAYSNISVEPFIVDEIDKYPLFRWVFSLARSFLIYVFTHISSARGDRHNKWTLKGKSYAMTMKTIEDAKCNFHVTSVLQTLTKKKLVENVTTSDEILAETKNEKRKNSPDPKKKQQQQRWMCRQNELALHSHVTRFNQFLIQINKVFTAWRMWMEKGRSMAIENIFHVVFFSRPFANMQIVVRTILNSRSFVFRFVRVHVHVFVCKNTNSMKTNNRKFANGTPFFTNPCVSFLYFSSIANYIERQTDTESKLVWPIRVSSTLNSVPLFTFRKPNAQMYCRIHSRIWNVFSFRFS